MSKNEIHVFSAVVVLFLCSTLKSAFALDSKIELHRGTPKLHVNGDIVAPLIFFNNVTHPDASTLEVGWREIRYAVAAGYNHHSTGIRNNLKMPWPKPGDDPDYRGVRKTMDDFLKLAPEGTLILRIDTDPPSWWTEANPAECIRNEAGQSLGRVSPASKKWRSEAEALLRGAVRFLEHNYGDHILGYHPGGQGYEPGATEWIHPSDDFGPALRDGFREWLSEKYDRDPSAFQRAWRIEEEGFESVSVPTSKERSAYFHGSFRDPNLQRRSMDFQEYLQVAMVEVLEQFSRAIKEETRRRKLVVLFYGYIFEISSQSGHHRLTRILECPDIDILCGPISYGDRALAGTAPFMAPIDSIQLHGKLWLNEDDTRTHLSAPDLAFGRVTESIHTTWVLRRNFAQALAHRTAAWWMTSGTRGWFDSKEIWDDLGALLRLYEKRAASISRYESEIAVIVDEESALHTHWNQGTRDLLYNSRSDLLRIGAPVGFYLLDDLVSGKVPEAKMYVFLNAFYISPDRRAAIRSVVCRDGKTAVWYWAPGFLAGSADTANMEALTGIAFTRLAKAIVPDIVMTRAGSEILRSVRVGEVFGPGETSVIDPVFAALEPQENLEVLGRYRRADPAAGFVIKRESDWNSVFVGSNRLPPGILQRLAAAAGVHIWLDGDDLVVCDADFLAIHARTAGKKIVLLPRETIVTDLITGDPVSANSVSFEIEMQHGETRMFSIR